MAMRGWRGSGCCCPTSRSEAHFWVFQTFLLSFAAWQFVSLPTIVEMHKTDDKKHLFKMGDLHQVLLGRKVEKGKVIRHGGV